MLFATTAVAGLFIAGNGANAHADTTNSQSTTTVSQSQQVESPKIVTVKSGDTLWGIAQSHNVKLDALRAVNQRQNSDLIYVGEKLVLPNGNTVSTPVQQTQTSQQSAQPAQNVQSTQTTPKVQPAQQAQTTSSVQPAQRNQSAANYQQVSTQVANTTAGNSNAAKSWIAQRESSGSYTATNGQYYGKYQLSSSLLHGDYSAANQEKVADQYVTSRYGSWDNAKSFWVKNGWY